VTATELTPLGTKRMIEAQFGSQLQAGNLLGFSDRQVRNWCRFGAPPHVARVLRELKHGQITLRRARRILRTERRRRPSAAPVEKPA